MSIVNDKHVNDDDDDDHIAEDDDREMDIEVVTWDVKIVVAFDEPIVDVEVGDDVEDEAYDDALELPENGLDVDLESFWCCLGCSSCSQSGWWWYLVATTRVIGVNMWMWLEWLVNHSLWTEESE